jgi:serine/threonine protein kinase
MVNKIDSPRVVAEFEAAIKATTRTKTDSPDPDLKLSTLILEKGASISLVKIYELGKRLGKTSLMNAAAATQNMEKLEGTGMARQEMLQTAFYIEKILPKYIQKGQNHREISVDRLSRTIDHDPHTGKTYIHVKNYGGAELLGVGGFKIVAKAIRYDRVNPELVARASGDEDAVQDEVNALKLAKGLPHVIQPQSIIPYTSAGTSHRKEVAIFLKLFKPGALTSSTLSCATIESLAPAEKLQVAHDAAVGISELHSKGLIHRDIKPGNIFIDKNPTTKKIQTVVADLGVLTTVAKAKGALGHGSVFFLPPEYYANDPKKADIWGLGCTFYMLLYGKWPQKPFRELPRTMILPNASPLKKFERLTWDMLQSEERRPSLEQVISEL